MSMASVNSLKAKKDLPKIIWKNKFNNLPKAIAKSLEKSNSLRFFAVLAKPKSLKWLDTLILEALEKSF